MTEAVFPPEAPQSSQLMLRAAESLGLCPLDFMDKTASSQRNEQSFLSLVAFYSQHLVCAVSQRRHGQKATCLPDAALIHHSVFYCEPAAAWIRHIYVHTHTHTHTHIHTHTHTLACFSTRALSPFLSLSILYHFLICHREKEYWFLVGGMNGCVHCMRERVCVCVCVLYFMCLSYWRAEIFIRSAVHSSHETQKQELKESEYSEYWTCIHEVDTNGTSSHQAARLATIST